MAQRNLKLDNLKGILIFLVVFCHFSQLFGGDVRYKMYMVVYTFHMPFFVFITGYFAKFNLRNIFSKFVYPYLVFQFLYTCFTGNAALFYTPFWLMWYLFSAALYLLTLPLVKKRTGMWLAGAVCIALGAGYISKIGEAAALSRTLCFYPFFLAGVWCRKRQFDRVFSRLPRLNGAVLLFLAFLCSAAVLPFVQTSWLYQSMPSAENGCSAGWRLILIGIAALWIAGGLLCMPNRQIKGLTEAGRYSLTIYLLHGFVQRFFLQYHNPFVFTQSINLLLAFLLSAGLCVLFGNAFFARLLTPLTDLRYFVRIQPKTNTERRCLEGIFSILLAYFYAQILYTWLQTRIWCVAAAVLGFLASMAVFHFLLLYGLLYMQKKGVLCFARTEKTAPFEERIYRRLCALDERYPILHIRMPVPSAPKRLAALEKMYGGGAAAGVLCLVLAAGLGSVCISCTAAVCAGIDFILLLRCRLCRFEAARAAALPERQYR